VERLSRENTAPRCRYTRRHVAWVDASGATPLSHYTTQATSNEPKSSLLMWPLPDIFLTRERTNEAEHLTWRLSAAPSHYGPPLAEGCSLLDGPARVR
jgi:hypothetical protein